MNIREEFRMPEWASNWKTFFIFALVSFTFAFGLRCFDLPVWSNPAFMVNGEYLMGTHDAYYWLAGAKGVGSAVGNPMSEMVRILGAVTGAKYGNIAFWLPAVFAGFTAIAAFAWGLLAGGPWVGVAAAVYATSVPAYYFRTRLTYYDTDVVTLFFPLLISVLLARWVSLGVRSGWMKNKNESVTFKPTGFEYLLPVIAGLVTSFGKHWHGDVQTFGIVTSVIAIGLCLLCGSKDTRPVLLRGLLLFVLSGFAGIAGIVVALVLLVAFLCPSVKEHKFFTNTYLWLALIVAALALSGTGQALMLAVSIKLGAYLKPATDPVSAVMQAGPKYPGIAQSVIEAQNVSFDILFIQLTGSELLAVLGFASFAYLLWARPCSILLLPFMMITFAAISMGGRFAMFGGIGLGIGLGFTGQLLLGQLGRFGVKRAFSNAAASLIVCFFLINTQLPFYVSGGTGPIISQEHATALIEAGKHVSEKDTIWTWWDWGYASMYFAGMHSFANGGHHDGPVLYPLALAFATPSFLQASQIIKFSSFEDNKPWESLDKMSGQQAQQFVNSLAAKKYNFKAKGKQYILVSWENLRLAYWIMHYGLWNVASGASSEVIVGPIDRAFDLDTAKGTITLSGNAPLPLRSYDFVEKGKRLSQVIKGAVGPHLIYNKINRQGFLTGDKVYSSMLIRLLIDNPRSKTISDHFGIVYDGFPSVRIYEVL